MLQKVKQNMEIWESNKGQVAALESIILGGAIRGIYMGLLLGRNT